MATPDITRAINEARRYKGNTESDLAILTAAAEDTLIGSLMLSGVGLGAIAVMQRFSLLSLIAAALCFTCSLILYFRPYRRYARARDSLLTDNITNLVDVDRKVANKTIEPTADTQAGDFD